MWMETRRCTLTLVLYEREITREPRLLVNAMYRAHTLFLSCSYLHMDKSP